MQLKPFRMTLNIVTTTWYFTKGIDISDRHVNENGTIGTIRDECFTYTRLWNAMFLEFRRGDTWYLKSGKRPMTGIPEVVVPPTTLCIMGVMWPFPRWWEIDGMELDKLVGQLLSSSPHRGYTCHVTWHTWHYVVHSPWDLAHMILDGY